MSTEEIPLGPLVVGIDGLELNDENRAVLMHPAVGGVILFSRNYQSPGQLRALTAEIRSLRSPRLLIAVDQEGGRVQRFRAGFTPLPPPAVLGRWHERQPDRARDLAYRHGRVMAAEVLGHGVDISFAPVLDLGRGNAAIGDRAFSPDPDVIADLGAWYLAGMKDAGMRTCGKHFPGHGSVAADTHHGVVTDDRELEALAPWDRAGMKEAGRRTGGKQVPGHGAVAADTHHGVVTDDREIEAMAPDLSAFRQLSERLDSIMMAHVRYPSVDDSPAGFSSFWINDVLKRQIGFEGLVISDDLDMAGAAAAGALGERISAALEAGCDAVLACCPQAVRELLEDSTLAYKSGAGLQALYGRPLASLEEQAQVPELQAWRKSLKALCRQAGTA